VDSLHGYCCEPSQRTGNQLVDHKVLERGDGPLYGFRGKIIHAMERIVLLVSFGTLDNTRTKHIAFDDVEMHYPYNCIFGKEAQMLVRPS
jgi:hypothetical protein